MRPASPLFSGFLRYFFLLLYEPFAWSYDFVAWLVSLGHWKSWVLSTLPYLTGPRVLELGQGPGHLHLALRAKGIHAIGLDRSRQMIRIAGRRLAIDGIAPVLTLASAKNIPAADNYFDQVVATFPTEYIYAAQTLAEIRRVLKPQGQLVLLPVAWLRGASPLVKLAAWLFRVTGQASSWDGSISTVLRSAGFTVEEKKLALKDSEVMLLIAKRG